MKPFDAIKNVYLIGIGGIGMSALAQYFALEGKAVAGYDKTPGKMTQKLKELGIPVSFDDAAKLIPPTHRNHQKTLVIYTAAVPADLEIFKFFRHRGYFIQKRAVILGEITETMPTLAVAGTHGKTTTSAILAHLLKQAGYKITAFVGGILENYDSNFIGDGREACVVEADEYDRSFLQLWPKYAAITSIDTDHLDIYNTPKVLKSSFHRFANKVDGAGNLFYNRSLNFEGNSVGIKDGADYDIRNPCPKDGAYYFDLKTSGGLVERFQMNLPGKYNLMNAGIALAMAIGFGVEPEKLKRGLKSFKGVKRRFSYHLKTEQHVLIEDYAHHPEEIKAVYGALREVYPNEKITAVFQPHLYSRTQDLAREFAESLAAFDEILLLPVYPAREKPIQGVNSGFLLELMANSKKRLIEKEELIRAVKNSTNRIIIMMGAGDIEKEVEPLKKALNDEN